MIYLKPMTASEFDEFKFVSQNTYATDLAKVEGISIAQAQKYAAEQFDKLLPEGLRTNQQYLYTVALKDTDQSIGYLWLGLQNRFNRNIASINDVAISAVYRGKGLGKLLMGLVEQESRKMGAARIRLHVFNQNDVAKRLYLSMGFEPTNIDMKKEL